MGFQRVDLQGAQLQHRRLPAALGLNAVYGQTDTAFGGWFFGLFGHWRRCSADVDVKIYSILGRGGLHRARQRGAVEPCVGQRGVDGAEHGLHGQVLVGQAVGAFGLQTAIA